MCVPLVSYGQDSREGLYGADGRLVHIVFFFPAHTETPHASFTLTDPLLQLRDLSLHPEKHPEQNDKQKTHQSGSRFITFKSRDAQGPQGGSGVRKTFERFFIYLFNYIYFRAVKMST